MALEFAATLEADGYEVARVVRGTNLPAGWFSGPRFEGAEKAARGARGCVSLDAGRPTGLAGGARKTLSFFVAQLASAADARTLENAAQQGGLGALLTATRRATVALMVARTPSGPRDSETAASLERFRVPLVDALKKG